MGKCPRMWAALVCPRRCEEEGEALQVNNSGITRSPAVGMRTDLKGLLDVEAL